VAGDLALVEHDVFLGIDTTGQIGGGHLASGLAQLVGVLRLGQRVQVDNAEDALVIVLQRDPVANGTEIIAEMQVAGRLNAGKDTIHRTPNSITIGAVTAAWRRRSSRLPAQPPQEFAPIGNPKAEGQCCKGGEPRADQHSERAYLQHRVTREHRCEGDPQRHEDHTHAK